MSTTTKSPRKVLVAAWHIAQRKLPAYRHRFSPQKFTQHQLFASLALKTLRDIVIRASRKYHIEHLLADTGYDSETNHRFAREQCSVRTTIPPTHGRQTDKPLRGRYRRQMQRRFPKKRYGQRWQVATIFSMIKRNIGQVVHARTYRAQCCENMLLVFTHNIAVVLFVKELFYRAHLTPLFWTGGFLEWEGGIW